MPYIKKNAREVFDNHIASITQCLTFNGEVNDGEVNYVISKILDACYNKPSYTTMSNAIKALECAKLEWYRKVMAPYEDEKLKENGPVYK